ncbi:MAG: MFS transporter [Acidobacteria bacterium]|nr:MAG: MFS transporter [Acidobacteriota bacterium]
MAPESAILSKLTRRLIPLMFLLYIVSYLDRINVGFAALQLNKALNFDPVIFGLGAGLFFIGYFIFEIPSNLIMERVGARVWMARILVTWGLISSAMMFVHGIAGFYVLRFLLGAAEAGFFPGMILYLTYWFPAEARGRAIARFMTATAIAGVVGGPVSGVLLNMHGIAGLAGWQWLFLIEGLPAVILGFVVFAILPDRPQDARWLTAAEKVWIMSRLDQEREAKRNRAATVKEAIASGRVWMLAFIYFAVITSFYGVSLWLPQIVRSFSGMSDLLVGFVSAIPYVAASLGMVSIGKSSDRHIERRWHVALSALMGAAGLTGAAFSKIPAMELAALSLGAIGIWGTLGPFWAMSSESLRGTGAAAGIALINSIGNLGGFLGPYLVGIVRSRTDDFALALLALAVWPFLGSILTISISPQPSTQILRTANGTTPSGR